MKWAGSMPTCVLAEWDDLEERDVGLVACGWTSDKRERQNHGTRTRC
jgi:hypothetical protein